MRLACADVRRRLAEGSFEGLESHLDSCPGCAAVADRWRAVRGALAAPPTAATPDPGFARRVTDRLAAPPDALGWAALRLFPVAAALAVVLGGWAWIESTVEEGHSAETLPAEIASWIVTTGEAQ